MPKIMTVIVLYKMYMHWQIVKTDLTVSSQKKTKHVSIFTSLLRGGLLSTHCILVDSSTVICLTSPFVILGVSGLLCHFYSFLMENPVSKHCRP